MIVVPYKNMSMTAVEQNLLGEGRAISSISKPAWTIVVNTGVAKGLIIPYISCFLFDCNAAILGLAIPIYALRLGASSFDIGLIGTASGLAYALTALNIGRLSSRSSPRLLLLAASILLSLIPVSYTLVPNFLILIPLSAFQSFSYGIYWPTIESLIAGNSSPSALKNALMRYNISWSVGWIVGPLLGGFFLSVFPTSYVFYLISLFFLSGFVLLATVRRDHASSQGLRETERGGRKHSWEFLKQFSFFYGLAFTYAFATRTYINFFPVYTTFLGIDPFLIGGTLLFIGLTKTLVFAMSGTLERYLRSAMIPLGLVLIASSMVITFFGWAPWHFALACAVLGFGSGISYSASLSTILGGEKVALGLRAGLFEGAVGIGSILGPLLGGLISQWDQSYPYAMVGSVCILIMAISLVSRQIGRRTRQL